MKKSIVGYFIVCIFIISCQQQHEDKLTIATAANMQFVMKELVKTFTECTAIECQMVVSSSGKLTAQIKEGAPYDVFLSANMKYPLQLFQDSLTTQSPKIYAYGELVLWSMIDDINPNIGLLNQSTIKHIAIANPKNAPYGDAAIDVLKHYRIFDEVKNKLVYGESIAQTNQFITTTSAEIGFTAKSVVLSSKMKGKGHWITIEKEIYKPIEQGVVLIKNEKSKQEKAKLFYDFLFSEKAKQILTTFGYTI